MPDDSTDSSGQAPDDEHGSGGPDTQGIDLQKLADKVYELMRAEARLSTARGQRLEMPYAGRRHNIRD